MVSLEACFMIKLIAVSPLSLKCISVTDAKFKLQTTGYSKHYPPICASFTSVKSKLSLQKKKTKPKPLLKEVYFMLCIQTCHRHLYNPREH